MGRNNYPKTLTVPYDLAVNWEGDTKGSSVSPNDGLVFTTESEEVEVHATNGINITQSGKPVVCHICINNHYVNRCPDREDSASKKNAEKVEETLKKESAPVKASFNLTIGEDWGDDTKYGGLIFCQVTSETAINKTLNID